MSEALSRSSAYYSLHWDAKCFKALTHCTEKQERVAVILTSADGDEILLGVVKVENGRAEEEHKKIISCLLEHRVTGRRRDSTCSLVVVQK